MVNASIKNGSRCQTSSNFAKTSTNLSHSLNRPRNLRLVDNAQERILKRYADNKFLDTEPNADVNVTWDKQVRKRNQNLEVGPAFRYTHRNTIERLEDKTKRDPTSSELAPLLKENNSPRKSIAATGGSVTNSDRNGGINSNRSGYRPKQDVRLS